VDQGSAVLGQGAALGNNANFAALAGQSVARAERREDRYRLRSVLNEVSTLKRCVRCGFRLVAGAQGVPVVLSELVAHFANLELCASVWACPVCSPRIRERRAAEIEDGLQRHLEIGGGAGFVTQTLPHDQGDRLVPLFDAVAESWRLNLGSKGWRRDVRAHGIVGNIRAVEITHGENGWHPHLHGLVLTVEPLDVATWELIGDGLHRRWSASVQRRGFRAPTRRHGVTLTPVRSASDVAQYTAKFQDGTDLRSVGRELTRHDTKQARRHGRTPVGILRDFADTGDADDLALWHEYERATKGRSSLRWSRGLKRRLHVGDVTDEDIVGETIVGEVLDVLSRPEWAWVRSRRLQSLLLQAAEAPERVGFDELMAAIRQEVSA